MTAMRPGAALEGVKVVEAAMYVFGPAAGAVLSDWGADVIRVEHPKGDPVRTTAAWGYPSSMQGLSYLWRWATGGSATCPSTWGRPRAMSSSCGSSTTPTSSSRACCPRRAASSGSTSPTSWPATRASSTRVRARSAPRGPESENGGFDGITYWARSGAAASVTPPDAPFMLSMPGPGFGDGQSGMMLAGGIAAALYRRERTGQGVVVDASLLATGLWAMQPGIASTSLSGRPELPRQGHLDAQNPLSNQYRTADGRFLSVAFLQSDKYWPHFCEVVGKPEWRDVERWADAAGRGEHRLELIAELDALFATQTLAEWEQVLSQQDGQWESIKLPGEVPGDEQAVVNGYVQLVARPGQPGVHVVAAPVQFDETAPELRPAPRKGEHTDEILRGLGVAPEEIARLRSNGTVA